MSVNNRSNNSNSSNGGNPVDGGNDSPCENLIGVSNNDNGNSKNSPNNNNSMIRDSKRQQFTTKQRIDMYAFCVLELELHSNKVSIKKQQQAIQRVLSGSMKKEKATQNSTIQSNNNQQSTNPTSQTTTSNNLITQTRSLLANPSNNNNTTTTNSSSNTTLVGQSGQQQEAYMVVPQNNGESSQSNNNNQNNFTDNGNDRIAGKTLLELQQEIERTRKCYSDVQKTLVLTSSMLRDVQTRFSRYYPHAAIPSRSTIKHVFDKCVNHGTVDNIRTPRRITKIPKADEIEHFLVHEPQLSLRQLAQKLKVSTGTVSRRCKALGLIPESVTIKHQQMAAARRQKQIKQMEDTQDNGANSSRANGNTN